MKNVVYISIIVILGIIILIYSSKYRNLSNESIVQQNNISALNDTIRQTKDKLGNIIYQKQALISLNGNLSTLNESLANEAKQLKGNLIYITQINGSLTAINGKLLAENQTLKDSIHTSTGDSISTIYWQFNKRYDGNNGRTIEGNSKFKLTNGKAISLGSTLDKFDIDFEISTGLSETKDKKLEIWVKTSYPYMTFTGINGALINPSDSKLLKSLFPQKRWQIGWQFGYGLGLSTMKFQPYVGIGVSYKIISF